MTDSQQPDVTRPGTRKPDPQTRKQARGWAKDLAFRFGDMQNMYSSNPFAPYI